MKWEKVKLGDLYTVHNGLSKGKKFFGTGFPFLSFSIVFNKWFIPEQLYDLVEVDEKERNSYSIKKGDVFITRTSETMEELGMSTVALKDYPNATYNGFTKRLRPITELLEPRFIGYYLRTPEFRGKFMAFSAMTTRASLTNDDLLSLEVPVPPLPVQQRIASILSAYDDLIENNQKQIKLLEEAAQRLYKEWFVDLRFPGHESVKIVDGVPEGWNKVRLDAVTSVLKRGISPKYDENGEFTVINQKCIRKNIVDYSESRKQSKKYAEELQLQESDTVICSTGIGTLGRVGQIYNVYQNSTFDSHVTLVRANKLIGKQFLFWSLKLLQPYLMSLGKGSTNQQELYKSDLTACFLLLPEEYIMNAFERQAQELHDIIAVKTKQISSLREARDRLLPKLMSGEIEV